MSLSAKAKPFVFNPNSPAFVPSRELGPVQVTFSVWHFHHFYNLSIFFLRQEAVVDATSAHSASVYQYLRLLLFIRWIAFMWLIEILVASIIICSISRIIFKIIMFLVVIIITLLKIVIKMIILILLRIIILIQLTVIIRIRMHYY